ncbi:MAG: FtsX-like permease family protein, partial [Acidobacteria bacterium]|nr:FtsX-like permease family protein [Acidobacteriota bacterium]
MPSSRDAPDHPGDYPMSFDWASEIRAAFAARGHLPDPDVVEELAQHAAATFERERAEDATGEEAEQEVRRQIDAWCADALLLRRRPGRTPLVEPPPAGRGCLPGLAQDLRYALRLIGRRPGHALVAVLTMALGIGATTALFGIANGVLLRPLPWPDSDRIVRLSEMREGGSDRLRGILTNATYLAWRDQPQALDAIAGYRRHRVTLTGSGEPQRLLTIAVTPSLFPMIGASPLLGSLFGPEDERREVVVISYGLWQARFGGDPGVIGRLIGLDGKAHEIMAVMPREFAFPDREGQAWTPFHVPPVVGDNPNSRLLSMFTGLGRLRPGVMPEQASAEGTARSRAAPDLGMVGIAVFGTEGPATVTAVPLLDAMTSAVRPALLVFLVAVSLLLVTATANVASLQLARATAGRRETAIRSALGAGRGRLARQLLVESSLLGLGGGVAGLLLAAAFYRALPSILPAGFPRLDMVAIDLRVVVFALALSIATGILFGLLPVWQARRPDLAKLLAEDGIAPVGGTRLRLARARALIMAGQVAIACVLLVGAALLGRTFVALLQADRGYDTANVLTAGMAMPRDSFTPERRAQLLGALLERLEGQAGILRAAISSTLPLTPGESLMGFTVPARDGSSAPVEGQAMVRTVSPGYFEALGIPIL